MDKIEVFVCSDDKFSPFVSTTLVSIMETTDAFINFNVISDGISKRNKSKILSIQNNYKGQLEIFFFEINTKTYFKNFDYTPYISKAAYGRFLIPNLKPNIKKAIYTDVDVIFTKSINLLWNEDLEGYPIGAVPFQRGKLNNDYYDLKTSFGVKLSHKWFMSGLLILDCNQWRNFNYTNRLTSISQSYIALKKKVLDQDILNICFENNYKLLDVKYCVIYKIFEDYYTNEEIEYLKKEQVIIHYPGGLTKPWLNKKLESGEYFWNIAKLTPYYNTLQVKSAFSHLVKKLKLSNYFYTREECGYKKIITIFGKDFVLKNKRKELLSRIQTLSDKIDNLYNLLPYIKPISDLSCSANIKLRNIQKLNVILLSIFDKICRKHGINYWLNYGTLLGAVRHKGFIPWDDDLDVGMPREDYEKIGDILKNELEQYGFIINYGKGFKYQIIRIIYPNSGVQLDIWPYDYYFKDNLDKCEVIKVKENISRAYKYFCHECRIDLIRSGEKPFPRQEIKRITSKIILENHFPQKNGALFNAIDGIIYGPLVVNNSIIFPLKRTFFENIECFVPNNETELLKSIYNHYESYPKNGVGGHSNLKNIEISDSKLHEFLEMAKNISNSIER